MAVQSRAFMEWAQSYDTAGPDHRSLVGHEEWLRTVTRPVLRLDSSRPLGDLVADVLNHPVVIAKRPRAS
jgi:hypothetical protein